MGKGKVKADSKPVAAPEPKVTAQRVVDRITGEGEKGVGKFAQLPLVSSLFDTTAEMQNAIDLLNRAHSHHKEIKVLTDGLDEAKEELTGICVGVEVPGYRYGNLCVAVSMQTQKRFNKDLFRDSLIDAGFDPPTVRLLFEKAHVQGDPFYKVELKDLG